MSWNFAFCGKVADVRRKLDNLRFNNHSSQIEFDEYKPHLLALLAMDSDTPILIEANGHKYVSSTDQAGNKSYKGAVYVNISQLRAELVQ